MASRSPRWSGLGDQGLREPRAGRKGCSWERGEGLEMGAHWVGLNSKNNVPGRDNRLGKGQEVKLCLMPFDVL